MTTPAWRDAWFKRGVHELAMQAWRGVEAQHIVATMRLVDSPAEQDVLEQLLERSKPAMPESSTAKHYLLATPFRYRPAHQSRFRRAGTRGIWYGADSLPAACAEVAYWRWRFVMDSAGLIRQDLLTQHCIFSAQVQGLAIDLASAPWRTSRAAWTHVNDYTATQAVADAARERQVQWIRYESVRAPGSLCAAVLDVDALQAGNLVKSQQTWACKANRSGVMMVRGKQGWSWVF
jgi:RES domain